MTEAEWLACKEPRTMLAFLTMTATERKLRLFACACCRRISHLLSDDRSLDAIGIGERCADGDLTEEEFETAGYEAAIALVHAENEAREALTVGENGSMEEDSRAEAITHAAHTAACAVSDIQHAAQAAARESEEAIAFADDELDDSGPYTARAAHRNLQCGFLQCIFGNAFRPVSIPPVWQTPTVTSLATAAYEERSLPSGELDPGRLAVLSDALEEAGCDNSDFLDHLRSPGPHVRGCWVVDLLLGKH